MDLIIVSARPDYWPGLAAFLRERGLNVHETDHPDQVTALLRDNPQGDFRLLILDLPYDFDSMRDQAAQMLALRPGLAVAATQAMPDYLFVQAAKGLRLFPLPRNPREDDLERLLDVCGQPVMARPTDSSGLS